LLGVPRNQVREAARVLRDSRKAFGDTSAGVIGSGALAPPPIHVLGRLSPEVVKQAHALLESNAVQGKLVMTC
jgi:hypothetical protein